MSKVPFAVVAYPALVGAVLAGVRKSRKLSQSQLADAVGVGVSTWSRIESGESALSIEQLAAAADGLGVAPSVLLFTVDEQVSKLRDRSVGTVPARVDVKSITALGAIPLIGASLSAVLGPIGAIGIGAGAAAGYLLHRHRSRGNEDK